MFAAAASAAAPGSPTRTSAGPSVPRADDSADQAGGPHSPRRGASRHPQAHGVAEPRLVDTNRRAQRRSRACLPNAPATARARRARRHGGSSLRHRQIPDEPPLTGLVVPVRPARRSSPPAPWRADARRDVIHVAANPRQPLESTQVRRRVARPRSSSTRTRVPRDAHASARPPRAWPRPCGTASARSSGATRRARGFLLRGGGVRGVGAR